jgi:hypothetical protein
MAHASPLTEFMCNAMKAPRPALRTADPMKLAAKYSIRPDWAAEYLRREREVMR